MKNGGWADRWRVRCGTWRSRSTPPSAPTPPALLLVLALAWAPSSEPASAQPTQRTLATLAGVSVSGGVGNPTSPIVALRLGLHTAGALVIEPGLSYVSYDSALQPRAHHLSTEIQAQLQWLRDRLRPYVGVGAGTRWIIRQGGDGSELAVSAAAGVRYLLTTGWLLRAEARMRTNEPHAGGAVDMTLGVGRVF